MIIAESSFAIRFPEHLAREKKEYCLGHLCNAGARIERENDLVFRVVCSKPAELTKVGWTLFHTHLANICEIIDTSGLAEARASAYPKSPKP